MEIQFCGAAREVTGSCFLMAVGATRFLVDCGLRQGGVEESAGNYDAFPFDPTDIDFIILTHAHVDHSGLIPKLVKEGFRGDIFATPATVDLARIMLLDSAYIQESETEWRTRKARRAGRRVRDPLYTRADAEEAIRLFRSVPYGEEFRPLAGIRGRFSDAGHILGSAFTELWLSEDGGETKMVFSGDVGQPGQPIIRDPEPITEADYLVMEATYGDRRHDEEGDPVEQLGAILEEAQHFGGNVIIPSFAVGRTQEVVYFLRDLYESRKLSMPVFVDSPLAHEATKVYRRHRDVFDEEALDILEEGGSIFNFPYLHYTQSVEESRNLNGQEGIVIISASGMAEAGRVRHHLKHNLWRPQNHVVLVGFQACGTLGRRLQDGVERVRILGEEIAVKAKVHFVPGLSAHADRGQLLDWVSHFESLKATFLVHGELQAIEALRRELEKQLKFNVLVPRKYQIYDLRQIGDRFRASVSARTQSFA
ncbi:MAG: MBL fold metallo-hydrolase [Actinobacteria bacterium]|nr:MBL fold metallo-hydrolase [Actinomycetota bacterium]